MPQIQENPYLQYFCGYKEYEDSTPRFDSSLLVHIRRRLTPEIIGALNEELIDKHSPQENSEGESEETLENHANKGSMIIDATCAPSNARYPTDTTLLNEAREKFE